MDGHENQPSELSPKHLICQGVVWELIRHGNFEPYSEVGRWWYGKDEIDIVGPAPNDGRILFAECKWTSEPVGRSLIGDHQEHAENVRRGPSARDGHFAVFSNSGFEDGINRDLESQWSLVSLEEIDHVLSSRT